LLRWAGHSQRVTAHDLASADRALASLAAKQTNLTKTLSLFTTDEASAPVVRELEALASQKQAMQAARERILERRASWEAAQTRLENLEAWCANVAAKLESPTYEQRRLVLQALGIQVTLFHTTHDPRYVITADIPLSEGIESDSAGTTISATAPVYMRRPKTSTRTCSS
jgi:hypothetical protein